MSRHARQRGFTLVELMVVVAMVAVLSLLAVYGVRKYVFASKASEPIYMIGLIKTAQEAWREEFNVYYSPSSTINSYFPNPNPGKTKTTWQRPVGESTDADRWRNLGVSTPNPVQFGYASVAGGPGDAVPALGTTQQTLTYTPNGDFWFVVKAVCDQNGDGKTSVFIGSSFTQEIYSENEEE